MPHQSFLKWLIKYPLPEGKMKLFNGRFMRKNLFFDVIILTEKGIWKCNLLKVEESNISIPVTR